MGRAELAASVSLATAAAVAYAALSKWKRVITAHGGGSRLAALENRNYGDFKRTSDELSQSLFGDLTSTKPWIGSSLAAAFTSFRCEVLREDSLQEGGIKLPPLNPAP